MKNLFIVSLTFFFVSLLNAQEQIDGSMKSYFANPVVEEGKRNIILQNRCGNRLTLMMFDDRTELEFMYKPNAYRRKEYKARNFSSRDNFTHLFKEVKMPMINTENIIEYGYDPFVTKLKSKTNNDGKNEITIVNLADENIFVLAARAPALIAIKPHKAFNVSNGLLTETFKDRGENIVSFIAFENNVENRFRVLSDGTYIIQIVENELVFFGGEENQYQMSRALDKYKGMLLSDLITANENLLAPKMNQGIIKFNNPDFQKVLDINHRIVYSGIDEGGACFGALNRIYYLMWIRDGSMTSSLMARAGNTEPIKIWTPFLLNNPSITRKEDGTKVPEFLQIVGTKWTRNEDDGLFYAALSLYTYFVSTGQDNLLQGTEFPLLIEATNRYLEKLWKTDKKLIISNTIGETPLKSDPYFGYDAVNGNYEKNDYHISQGKEVALSASLYNQVNTYNLLLMITDMLSQRKSLDKGYSQHYLSIAEDIKQSLKTIFYDKPNDCLLSGIEYYTDGTEGKLPMTKDVNPWEGSWACAIGPFFPVPDLQLKTARVIYKTWPVITKNGYGYCPWNTLSKVLTEYGMPSDEYEKMLSPQIKDALALTVKYPMPGGLTEYNRNPESWRALPFSAGSLFFSMSAQMISGLPNGIALRASNKVDSIKQYRYQLSSINASASGKGDVVQSFTLNGEEINASLQIPENMLLTGQNTIEIKRGMAYDKLRLFSSSAQLLSISKEENSIVYRFISNVPTEIYFENIEKAKKISILNSKDEGIKYNTVQMHNTKINVLEVDAKGSFSVKVEL